MNIKLLRGRRPVAAQRERLRQYRKSRRFGSCREHRGQCSNAERGAHTRDDGDHRGQRAPRPRPLAHKLHDPVGHQVQPDDVPERLGFVWTAGARYAPMPFAGSAASVSRNESANAEYSVNPFSNNDKTQGLLKPIQPEMMESYWKSGWPRETLMWLFVNSVQFAGEPQPWFIDGDEFSAAPSAIDIANTRRYVDIIAGAKRGEITFGQLPDQTLDQRNCKPYDATYLRDTLGGGASDGGRSGMSDIIRTVEGLTGRQMVPHQRRAHQRRRTAGCS